MEPHLRSTRCTLRLYTRLKLSGSHFLYWASPGMTAHHCFWCNGINRSLTGLRRAEKLFTLPHPGAKTTRKVLQVGHKHRTKGGSPLAAGLSTKSNGEAG